jgi:anaerobic ribonucleoside-triphosphate reductase activating protein
MNYAEIKPCSIENGVGVRVSLFVSGCRHHCKGCFNEETWDFAYGKPFTTDVEQQIIDQLTPGYIKGLTLLGGDPGEPENQEALLPLMRRIKAELPDKTIWSYSGYLYEDFLPHGAAYCDASDEYMELLDVLVDGPFIMDRKDISLQFRGSDNQRIIDVKRTRESGDMVLFME